MKLTAQILMVTVFVTFTITQANEKPLPNSVLTFGTLLNIPVISTSTIWTSPLFTEGNTITTNGFEFVYQNKDIFFEHDFNLTVSSNEQTVVYGKLWEETTYEDARLELIFSLVNNNMGAEQVALGFNSYTNSVGDFTLVPMRFLPTGVVITNDFSELHFVRGAKTVSLFGKDGADVKPIAETLDALLKNSPAN